MRARVWKLELSITASLDHSTAGRREARLGDADSRYYPPPFSGHSLKVTVIDYPFLYSLLEGPPPGKKQLTFKKMSPLKV